MAVESGIPFFVDTSNQILLEQLLARDSNAWPRTTQSTPNFGYTAATYWFHLPIRHAPDGTNHPWYLEVGYPLLDEVTLYTVVGGRVIEAVETGDARPFRERPVEHRNFLFPLKLEHDGVTDLYLRVRTTSAMQVPLALGRSDALLVHNEQIGAIHGIYFGMMLVMVLYNFVIYLVLRDSNFLTYVWFVSSIALIVAIFKGFAFQYLWPQAVAWNGVAILVFGFSAPTAASLFANEFLRLATVSPALSRTFKALALTSMAGMVGAFALPYTQAAKVALFIGINVSLLCLAAGILAIVRDQRNKPATYFTLAWTVFLFGTVVLLLSKFGLVPRNAFTENLQQIGSAMEAVLLSFALAYRFDALRREAERDQRMRLEFEAQTRQEKMASEVRVLAERERIARDLHDNLAQGIAATVLQLEAAEACVENAEPPGDHLRKARDTLREYLDESRRVIHGLRPGPLAQSSLQDALGELVACTHNSGVQADFSVSGDPRLLSIEVEGQLLRIAQEAFGNACRHSQASCIQVRLAWMRSGLLLEVRDNGIGFDTSSIDPCQSHGLGIVHERARALAARVMVESHSGDGTSLRLELPIGC